MADRSPSRLFEFEPQNRNGPHSNGYRFENNGSFTPVSQRWLALLMVLAMSPSIYLRARSRVLRSRTGHERWYLGRNISRVPTTFSRNKIADIERETKRPARRCKFHANLRLSVNSSAFTTASVRSQGIENSLPFREILRTSFIICYLFLRDK